MQRSPRQSPRLRLLPSLAQADAALSQRQIRQQAATRHKTVGDVLHKLVREGRVHHDAEGRYSLVADLFETRPPDADACPANAARFPVPAAHA